MSTPLLNFVAAILIGLAIGGIGGFVLRGSRPKALMLAPVLATAGALIASVLAAILGDQRDYGYKEAALQVVLALGGVALAYVMGATADKAVTSATSE